MMWESYVCEMVVHNASYIHIYVSFHSFGLSYTCQVSFTNQWPYSGAVWEKRIGQIIFQKPHRQSVLKLSLGYRSSYLSQTVLPINELLLSFYTTEIIWKLKCRILCRSDSFDWAYATLWTTNSRQRNELCFLSGNQVSDFWKVNK